MVIFGGIFEITREMNDFFLFDLKNNKWITLFEETSSPAKYREVSPDDNSPGMGGNSPAKRNT
jgi:Galactose oxidase, central domain